MNLYSQDYQSQLTTLYKKTNWGGAVKGKIPEIIFYLKLLDVNDVLDYGCGYGCFKSEVERLFPSKYVIDEYDPGIVEKSHHPSQHNVVICIDVLEHIEPEYIYNILDDLKYLTKNICVVDISLEPSKITLPDGRNAHLSIYDAEWWIDNINERFNILKIDKNYNYCKLILKKK